MKYKKHFLLLLSAVIATAIATSAHAAINLTVDAGDEFKEITRVGSGSLYGITRTIPADLERWVKPLNPYMFTNPGLSGRGHQHNNNAAAVPVAERLWDSVPGAVMSITLPDMWPGWPYQYGGWERWEEMIRGVVSDKLASRAKNFYGYVIWNEPLQTWGTTGIAGWNDERRDSYHELWRDTYRLLREVDPEEDIIGPCFSWYNEGEIERFLNYGKAHDVVPDIMCWHSLGGTAGVTNDVSRYRALERRLSIPTLPISLNEYGESHESTETPYEGNPGRSAAFIAKLERLNIHSANISWWHTCCAGRLGSLMANDSMPGAGWFFYRWYGEMSGKMITVIPPNTNTKRVDGFASIDHEEKYISLLFGGENTSDRTVNVTFNNLPSWMGASAMVKIEGVDWKHRDSVSSGPYTISETEHDVTNNSLTVSVTNCLDTSGYRILVTPGRIDPDPLTGYFFHHTFEDGTTQGWTPRFGAGTATNTGAQKANGSRSLSMSEHSEGYHGPAYNLSTTAFVPGQSYGFSVIAMFNDGPDAAPFKLTLQYNLNDEPVYGKIDSVVASKGNWVMLENANFPIPAGASDLVLYVEMPDNGGTTFYIDDAMGGIAGAQPPGRDGVTSISDRFAPVNNKSTRPLVAIRGKMLNVTSPGNGELTIRIIDVRGRTRASFNATSSSSFSLTAIPAGRYFVDVRGPGVRQTLPIIAR